MIVIIKVTDMHLPYCPLLLCFNFPTVSELKLTLTEMSGCTDDAGL